MYCYKYTNNMGFTSAMTMTLDSNDAKTTNDQDKTLSSIAETESMIDLSSLDFVNKQHEDDASRFAHRHSTSPNLAESDVSSVSTKSSVAAASLEDVIDAPVLSELDILKARWKKMNNYLKKLENAKKHM